jgi:phage terminase large subunit-like protein
MAKAQRFFVRGPAEALQGRMGRQPIQLSAVATVHPREPVRVGPCRDGPASVPVDVQRGAAQERQVDSIAATWPLYLTFFDGEPGAEGYTVATKRDQAKIVFADAKKMVESSGLKSRIGVNAWRTCTGPTRPASSNRSAPTTTRRTASTRTCRDRRVPRHKDRGLIDVMETATGARRSRCIFGITTAGNDPVSPCGDQHDYACKILDGVLEDESTADVHRARGPRRRLARRATWAKANPNWGISVKPDDMRKLARKAPTCRAAAATFKQKRLNLWVNADTPWLSMEGWRKGQSKVAREAFRASLKGQRCFVGVDLSSKIDLTAVVLLFPPIEARPKWAVLVFAFTPEDTLDERAHRDRAPYRQWKDAGWLETTPGNRIDYDALRDTLRALRDEFDIEQVGFDPWNAGNLEAHLMADGFDVLEVPQTVAHMSAPSKEFEADVLDGDVDSGSNPLMAWCISNVVVQRDNKDNIHPTKKKSRGRIDPVIGAIIARKLAGVDAPAPFSGVVRNLADFL